MIWRSTVDTSDGSPLALFDGARLVGSVYRCGKIVRGKLAAGWQAMRYPRKIGWFATVVEARRAVEQGEDK